VSFVAVVQPTNFEHCYHSSQFGSLDRPRLRRVLVQRKMRPGLVIVGEVRRQSSTQGGFPEDEHMVQALAPEWSLSSCASPIIHPVSASRSNTLITMVKSANFSDGYDRAIFHDFALNRAFLPSAKRGRDPFNLGRSAPGGSF
jgi:hypothetical protein